MKENRRRERKREEARERVRKSEEWKGRTLEKKGFRKESCHVEGNQ